MYLQTTKYSFFLGILGKNVIPGEIAPLNTPLGIETCYIIKYSIHFSIENVNLIDACFPCV